MLAETHVFGLTLLELAAIAAAIGYMTSLVKDWRPMRALRAENVDLRTTLDGLQRRLDAAEEKIGSQREEIERLKKATDLSILQAENAQILSTLNKVAADLAGHDVILAANTSAIVLLTGKLNGQELIGKDAA